MPGQYCCVNGCLSRSHSRSQGRVNNGVRFFAFPKWKRHEGKVVEEVTKRRRIAWIAAVRRKDICFDHITASMKVCSRHFHSGQPAYEMLESHPDWKPSLHLGHSEVKATDKERFVRLVRRRGVTTLNKMENSTLQEVKVKAQEEEQEVTPHMIEVVVKEEEEEVEVTHEEDDVPQTPNEESTEEPLLDSSVDEEIVKENGHLKNELAEFKMTEQFLKDDDEKVKYYTGLPSYATFQVLLSNIMPFLPHEESELTHFQMILLTFMRLKLDLPMEHISHLLNVHLQTARAAFNSTVRVLHARLSPLVRWPDRERLWVSMPHQFMEAFGKHLAVIVDFIEVSIEKPFSLETMAQRLSSDERGCTMKYLIGITPQGIISFISKGLDGRTSDKEITESCGLLNKLLPGDIILAGQGFDIEENLGMMCVEVKLPAFTKGAHLLDAMDVEKMRKITHLRTHVERFIGVVRNTYKILSSDIPVSMVEPRKGENVSFIEKVLTVCCALSNVCPSSVLCAVPEIDQLWLKQL
ncbi:uncharacterized protein LOC121643832 [Melanotaenia boesemani]|uniref:uncharacterized protein LOC121643832 n=1 Tax=Melanotaenia boesemani TaxID=1250792 RepID=UPI001C0547C3|nr:uncharacterized protein LOC121643832 [Melanotaenia boesemani]